MEPTKHGEETCHEGHTHHEHPHDHHEHHKHHGKDLIHVTVKYPGHPPFQGEVEPTTTVGDVKLKAMKQFGLEASAAPNYVLQHDGADQNDTAQMGSYGKKEVTFDLALKKEVNKG